MLAYAPRPERRRLNPPALALIIGAHAVAILAVMSAKMDVVPHYEPPIKIDLIREPPPPEPQPQPPAPAPNPAFTNPRPVIEPPPMPGPIAPPLPPTPMLGPVITTVDPIPIPKPLPIVRSGPRFNTPPEDIRPPYPESMRAQEREAMLRLRLSIDERGRVVAVEPVGRAEPAFLAAARRHILKVWRYRPAMEGDRAIASTTIITLEFRLDS